VACRRLVGDPGAALLWHRPELVRAVYGRLVRDGDAQMDVLELAVWLRTTSAATPVVTPVVRGLDPGYGSASTAT
jgi:hypothetical protein